MKLQSVFLLNVRKYRVFRSKALFLIVPITLLVALSVAISSQAHNISQAAETSIYGTAAQQARLIELSRNQIFSAPGSGSEVRSIRLSGQDENYSEADVAKVKEVANVTAASVPIVVPLGQIVAKNVFAEAEFTIPQLKALDPALAGLYTEESFDYQAGQPIPVILNSAAFVSRSENWQGRTEIQMAFGRRSQGNAVRIQDDFPIKNEAIPFDKEALLGKEFQMEIGGLEPLATFDSEFTAEGSVLQKLSDEELAQRETNRKTAISKYWNYDVLSQPLSYTFKVVGVIESKGFGASYVPAAFADTAMRDLIQHQLDARTDVPIPTADLSTTWLGITYDGLELQAGGGGFGGFAVKIGGPAAESVTTYTIPGLVIETERATDDPNAFLKGGSSGDVKGISLDPNVFTTAAPRGDTLIVQIAHVDRRAQVVRDLNAAGFTYQDIDQSKVYGEIQSTVRSTVAVTLVAFVVLSVFFVTLMLTKSVSESRKEIGVFRAIGARKGDIQKLFVSQALVLTVIGYLAGTLVGLGLTLAIAAPTERWFRSLVDKTVGQTFQLVQEPTAGMFRQIDWPAFLMYSGILLAVAVLASILPAVRASRVSPIQAIRNE